MINKKIFLSIFADQQHWLAGESFMGALATTTSSLVSEEPFVTAW